MRPLRWCDLTADEQAAANQRHLERVAAREADGPRFCRQTEGHACTSWCAYCGRCCDCRHESGVSHA